MKGLKTIKKTVDELFNIRQEIKMNKNEEEELVGTVKQFMLENDLDVLEGTQAYVEMSMRPRATIDPESYYEKLEEDWDRFCETISVRNSTDKKTGKLGARKYLGEEEILEISEVTEVPVMRVKLLPTTKTKVH
jgi:cellobiose phosphorylase